MPVNLRDERRGNGQFALGLACAVLDRLVCKHHTTVVAERGQGMDGAATRCIRQAPALRLAIAAHALPPARARQAWRRGVVRSTGTTCTRLVSQARAARPRWRAPHSAIASAESWFARIAATARARIAPWRSACRAVVKTRLLHFVLAAGLNLLRLAAWLAERLLAQTRDSAFARLAPALG